MEYGKQQQHQQQQPQQPMDGQNNGGSLNSGDVFVQVMTDEQMEMLRKQIAAYATICEQLEDLHRSLVSHTDPLSLVRRNPYCTPFVTSASHHNIPRRQRWNPTAQQLHILERVFDQGNETPSKEKVKDITAELAKHGQIAETNVYNWFQNRRARLKKKQPVAVYRENTETEVEMVTELSPEEGENSKPMEPMINSQNYSGQKVSAGKSMLSFDQQGIQMQQPTFALEGFHGSMSTKSKMHQLLEDMDANPPECYNPCIHAENYINVKGK